ncbi:hypothetical protein ACFQ3Z_18555 [Streptomyces nogalater]
MSTAYGDYEQRDLKAALDITADALVPGGDWTPAKGSVTNLGRRDLPKVDIHAYPGSRPRTRSSRACSSSWRWRCARRTAPGSR